MIRAGRFAPGRQWRPVLQGTVAAALVFLGACSRTPPADLPDPSSPEADISISVENRRSDDVVIELVRDGQKQRLGMVTAQNKTAFTLPWSRLSNASRVLLTVHPIGTNGAYATENLVLRPGSEVDLTVNQVLRQSIVSVY